MGPLNILQCIPDTVLSLPRCGPFALGNNMHLVSRLNVDITTVYLSVLTEI